METLFRKHRILISQVSMTIVRQMMHTVKWGAAISVNPRFSWRWQDDTDASVYSTVVWHKRRRGSLSGDGQYVFY